MRAQIENAADDAVGVARVIMVASALDSPRALAASLCSTREAARDGAFT
jgi:hypothetical protein